MEPHKEEAFEFDNNLLGLVILWVLRNRRKPGVSSDT